MMRADRMKFLLSAITVLFLIMGIRTPITAAEEKTGIGDERIDKLMRKLRIIPLHQIMPPDDFVLKDLDGNMMRLTDYRGKVVFLNFWTTWCPDCRIEMPSMEKLYRKFKSRDFTIGAINLQETAKDVEAFFKRYRLTIPVLLDRDGIAGRLFGIRSIPATFILNQKGGMIGKAFGPREWDGKVAEQLFDLLIKKQLKK
ncbi:MAG: TlpA family protein disulfide reductase [Deltaproteobacteria bacterium]|nr:TlpA family protein disulfide reductase [Deltaproteobacteria bacterium]